jgi:hypothetical protein
MQTQDIIARGGLNVKYFFKNNGRLGVRDGVERDLSHLEVRLGRNRGGLAVGGHLVLGKVPGPPRDPGVNEPLRSAGGWTRTCRARVRRRRTVAPRTEY